MRTGTGLRVVLGSRSRNVFQNKALNSPVVEIHVAQLCCPEVGVPADRLIGLDPRLAIRPDHCEAMVLARYVDPPCRQVLHRMVRAAVPEWQLEGLQANRPAEQLVP